MVLIFDLDDTLYDEMSFVTSGLRAVARFGETLFGWEADQSLAFMQATLLQNGRGQVFDAWLKWHSRHSRARVAECMRVYRHHRPEISLFSHAAKVLQHYHGQWPMYLVTDGHKVVQEKKINALGLAPVFKRTFLTHRFGVCNAKPSLHCFEIIRRTERCEWSEMVYVGDNPAKDFVSLNIMGALTVRVSTGTHASVIALPDHDAIVTVPDLSNLEQFLERWNNRPRTINVIS